MNISCEKVDLSEILPFRQQYLSELNCQIRYEACHIRGWSDSYLISVGTQKIGYGSVKGLNELSQRNAIFEFYLEPKYRNRANTIYQELIGVSGVRHLECQTNDFLHTQMVMELGSEWRPTTILFKDSQRTNLQLNDALIRPRAKQDLVFEKSGGAGANVLLVDGQVVASGGFLLHYNEPFADLYMETKKDCRRKGYASFMLQELKKVCYKEQRIPAARCRINNKASKATLLKAGLQVAGYMLKARCK